MTATVELRAGALILDLARRHGIPCAGCGAPLCGHALIGATVLGFRHLPRCTRCLAEAFGHHPAALARDLAAHVARRECFAAAWAWATAHEGPCAVVPDVPAAEPGEAPLPAEGADVRPDAEWDAGDMACGDLVLELRSRLGPLPPRGALLVTAHDPGAPEDIPAWCRLTGHALVYAAHPMYCIRRREDRSCPADSA